MLATFVLPPAERAATAPPSRAPQPAPGPRFADMLQRGPATHGVLATPAAPPPKASADGPPHSGHQDADQAADDATPSQAQATARSSKLGTKAAMRSREKAPPTTPAEAPSSDAATAETARRSLAADEGAGAATAPPTAELRDWLASLKLQPGSADTPADAATDRAGVLAAQAGAPGLSRAAQSAEAAAEEGNDSHEAGSIADAAAAAPPPVPNAMADSERRAGPADTLPHSHDAGPQPTLPGAAGAALPARGFDLVTNPSVTLPTPLHAPEFAQLLGAQVSLLARDGVQQAELHLNPAEMGPISVQIEIDGAHARVDFSADAATTREIIERGLPELAAALREQGLTLSGGGVFQQPPDRRSAHEGSTTGAGDRSRRNGQLLAAAEPAPIARQIAAIAPGRLDVYA